MGILSLLVLAPLALVVHSQDTAPSPAQTPKKAIVIGAGMSGAQAVRSLYDAGYAVTVLEARTRTGGRIHTDRTTGIPVDLGASWIHGGGQTNPVKQAVDRFGIGTVATSADSLMRFTAQGQAIADKTVERSNEAFKTLERNVAKKRIESLQSDETLEAAI